MCSNDQLKIRYVNRNITPAGFWPNPLLRLKAVREPPAILLIASRVAVFVMCFTFAFALHAERVQS